MLSFNLYIAKACAENNFGSKCQQQCGNCKNGDVCNHVTGICPTGCAEGWIGSRCNIGKTTSILKLQFRSFFFKYRPKEKLILFSLCLDLAILF